MTEVEKQEIEERRQLRPYRRLVALIFTVALIVASVFVLRGIIRHLDRLPSVDAIHQPASVDLRALKACADDLEKLEARVRVLAGKAFAAVPVEGEKAAEWQALAAGLELERVTIVARCRLHEPSSDVVVKDLETAANAIENLLRSYALIYGRHVEDGISQSVDARRALGRAMTALRAR
jgi:hypothetical protein